MTFILNILHKDFTILASDKQAGASGNVTLEVGGTTININSPKITINGFNKLFTNKPNSVVAGMAGVTGAHTYIEDLQSSGSVHSALIAVHEHAARFYLESDKAPLYRGEPTSENQALICYFDEATDRFTTNVIKFAPIYMNSSLFHSTAVGLLHIGTGSPALEAAVSVDKRKEFADSILNESNPSVCLDWLSNAFEVVSKNAEGCGKEFVAYAATRESPVFQKIHG